MNLPIQNSVGERQPAATSIINLINIYFDKKVIGCELGVARAQSSRLFLHACPIIQRLYLIDSYKAFEDSSEDRLKPTYIMTEEMQDLEKSIALHTVKYSKNKEKVIFIEGDSEDAAKSMRSGSLDFILMDAHLTINQLKRDLLSWEPKTKRKSLICVHDAHIPAVYEHCKKFCENRRWKYSYFDMMFVMKKV